MKPLSWLARRILAPEHRKSEARAGVLRLKLKSIPDDVVRVWLTAHKDMLNTLTRHEPLCPGKCSRPLATSAQPALLRLRARLSRLRRHEPSLLQAYRHVLCLAHHYGGAAIIRTLGLPAPSVPKSLRTAHAIRQATDKTARAGRAWRQAWMIEARQAFAIGTSLLALLRRPVAPRVQTMACV